MKKPEPYNTTETPGDPIVCKDTTWTLCGDPDTTVPYERVWCVPPGIECPVTFISWDASATTVANKLVKSFDAADGEPLIDV